MQCNDVNWSTPKIYIYHANMVNILGIFPTGLPFPLEVSVHVIGPAFTKLRELNFSKHGVIDEKVGLQ